jgi:hypothetical protein
MSVHPPIIPRLAGGRERVRFQAAQRRNCGSL